MEITLKCLKAQLEDAAFERRNSYDVEPGSCPLREQVGCSYLLSERGGIRDMSGFCQAPGAVVMSQVVSCEDLS